MKKILAILLSAAMVVGMSMPAMAENVEQTSPTVVTENDIGSGGLSVSSVSSNILGTSDQPSFTALNEYDETAGSAHFCYETTNSSSVHLTVSCADNGVVLLNDITLDLNGIYHYEHTYDGGAGHNMKFTFTVYGSNGQTSVVKSHYFSRELRGDLNGCNVVNGSSVHVNGWVFDTAYPDNSIDVHVYAVDSAGNKSFVGSTTANVDRSDVRNAYYITGNHGFDATFSTKLCGTYKFQVYGVNTSTNTSSLIEESDSMVFSGTPISNCTATLGTSTYTYDGTAKKPSVTVKNGTTTLVNGTDYTVSYSNNTNAGTATATITGCGNYTGSVNKTFTINKADAGMSFASSSLSKKTTDSTFANSLTKKTNATVSYSSSNTSVATVSSSGVVTIKGAGTTTITATAPAATNYNAGTAKYTLSVTSVSTPAVSIGNCTVTLGSTSYTYDGTAKKPSVTVKNGTTTLVSGTDYSVSYSNNINAGTATATVTGSGKYTGSVSKSFTINKADAGLSFASTSLSKITIDSTFTNTLTKKTDATVSYSSSSTSVATVSSSGVVTIKGAGTAKITATAPATTNYNAGSATYTINVTSASIANCTVTLNPTSYTYDGTAKKPSVTVKNGTTTLVNGTDYTVSYSNNTNAGTATVTITGSGKYTGSVNKTFTINKADAGLSFESSALSKKTTDSTFTNTLTKNTNATVTYSSSNTSVATVSSSGVVTIKGEGSTTITATAPEATNYNAGSANYTLSVTSTSTSSTSISNCTVTLGTTTYVYNGSAKKPSVTVKNGTTTLVNGTDYTVSYSNNVNAGTATVTITGSGKYTGSVSKTFTINKADAGLSFEYSSISKKTSDSNFTNTLTKDTNATVSYSSSNTNVATVSSSGVVTIKGAGTTTITATTPAVTNYKAGSDSFTLQVTSTSTSTTSISKCTVTLNQTSYTYDGSAKKPSVTVKNGTTTLVNGTDYTVSYSNNTNAGTATVIITGCGKYTGSVSNTFTINKAAAGLSFASSSVSKKTTDGNFTNTLTKNTNATVSYSSSNTNVATVSSSGVVTIKGAGTTTITATAPAATNYNAGSATYTITVTSTSTSTTSISKCTVTLNQTSYTYDGSAKKPSVTVKNGTTTLVNGTDYTVSYSNNINIGTATVTITGCGKYTGSVSKTFTIKKATENVKNGICKEGNQYAYFINGVRQYTTGLIKVGSATYNLVKGVVTPNTVVKDSKGLWYINSIGVVDLKYSGFADNRTGKTWYIQSGKVNLNANGLLKGTYKGVTKWGYVKNGQVQKAVALVKNASGLWYVGKDGFVNFSFTGIAKNSSGWWYCKGGMVQYGVNDILYTTCNGVKAWYNIRGGKLVASTVAKNSSGWWYIDKYGKVDFSFTGIAKNASGLWYCKGGKVQFGYSGTYTYKNVKYVVKNGKATVATSTSTGVLQAYANVLRSEYANSNRPLVPYRFTLIYIDNNNTPELAVFTGVGHLDQAIIYTYINGKAVYAGDAGTYGTLCYGKKMNRVYGYNVESNIPVTSKMLKNGKIVTAPDFYGYTKESTATYDSAHLVNTTNINALLAGKYS